MEQLAGVLTDDEEFLELVEILEPHRAVKVFQMRENHFIKWSDTDFIKRFRLSKDGVRFLLNLIRNQISHPTNRNNAVSPEDMLFVTLRFYATGSFLQVAGDLVGIDKSTASRIVYKVSRIIAGLNKEFIKMPKTNNEMRFNSQQFYNISRFPKCIGAIDCTHIKISLCNATLKKLVKFRELVKHVAPASFSQFVGYEVSLKLQLHPGGAMNWDLVN